MDSSELSPCLARGDGLFWSSTLGQGSILCDEGLKHFAWQPLDSGLNKVGMGFFYKKKKTTRRKVQTSLVVQWLRIRLPVEGTQVRSLVQEDPTSWGPAQPRYHSCWSACAQSPCSATRGRHGEQPAPAAARESRCAAAKTQHSRRWIQIVKRERVPGRRKLQLPQSTVLSDRWRRDTGTQEGERGCSWN